VACPAHCHPPCPLTACARLPLGHTRLSPPAVDLESAFSLADAGLCGGNRYTADDGARCLSVRHDMCQEVEGGGAGFCLRWVELQLLVQLRCC
jgi:hypothetical protein